MSDASGRAESGDLRSRLLRARASRRAFLGDEKGVGCTRGLFLALATIPLWGLALVGFVTTPQLIALSLAGPVLLAVGLHFAVNGVRRVSAWPWYVISFAFGLLVLLAAAATLAPGAPGPLLATTASGWELLDLRSRRVQYAVGKGDGWLAWWLACRGLGTTTPLTDSGRPLLHRANDGEMLETLLGCGLDPDARDPDGRTLLFDSSDLQIARVLLASGADPNARDVDGETVLDAGLRKGEPFASLLRQSGASERSDPGGRTQGRSDWLVVERDPDAAIEPSGIVLGRGPLRDGEVATLGILFGNTTEHDRLLDVSASLSPTALFVGASHDGAIESAELLGPWQTVRWRRLALPAWSQGRLELTIVARAGERVRDLLVDVRSRLLTGLGEAEDLRIQEVLSVEPRVAGAVAGWVLAGGVVLWVVLFAPWSWPAAEGAAPSLRDRTRHVLFRAAAALAAVVCLGLAAQLSRGWIEPLLFFDETRCTVLDRRIQPERMHSASSRIDHGANVGYAVSPGRVYGSPIAAVRVETGTRTGISTGFASGWDARWTQELRFFPLGATVPCWTHPEDPSVFTLVRSPSLQGAVGTLLLLGTGAALALLARAMSTRGPRWRREGKRRGGKKRRRGSGQA